MAKLIERVETSNGHFYRHYITKQSIPGVTTVLKCLPKDALESWKVKQAVTLALEGPDAWSQKPDDYDLVTWLSSAGSRVANKAAQTGTNAHDFAEKFMLGMDPDIESLKKAERKHVECFLQFVRDFAPEPILVEKVLTYIDSKSGQPLYCGTMDLLAKLYWKRPEPQPEGWEDGLAWLVDYKASSSQVRSSYALQASAYRHATHWLDHETGELVEMPHVDRTAVILLNGGTTDRCYRMVGVDSSPVVFSVFKSLLRISNFQKVEDKVILDVI